MKNIIRSMIAVVPAVMFMAIAGCIKDSNDKIIERKRGEDIGYQIGWNAGSNALYQATTNYN